MTIDRIEKALPNSFGGLAGNATGGLPVYRGKVRDVVRGKGKLLLVASDRISAFDRVLSTVPFKGEVLNRISRYWFEHTSDIVPNHLVDRAELKGAPGLRVLEGRASLAREASMLPVEVVVRGYLTGSAWRDYQAGRPVSGLALPEGLRFNEKFPVPLITPSTKEASGHDRPISPREVVSSGLVQADLWAKVEAVSIALFRRGQELAAARDLILVDTKYEFGLVDGQLRLCDEIHTPDSSRYWYAEGYDPRFAAGDPQKELDKEAFRRWLLDRGFSGEGSPPDIPDPIRVETARRYLMAFEALTGELFEPAFADPQAELASLRSLIEGQLS